MQQLLRLALRSLLRNRRRSLLTLAAVTVGVAVVVFAYGFGDGMVNMIVDSAVESRLGAIQIHKKGYARAAEASPLSYDLDLDDVMARASAVPGVAAVAPRLRFTGTVSNGVTSSMVIAEAVDPTRELVVCPERKNVPPSRGGTLGADMARAMKVEAGGTLTLTAPGQGGALNALDLDIAAVVPGSGFLEQKRIMTVTLAYAQEMVGFQAEDGGAGRGTEIAVRLAPGADVEAVAARLRTALGPELEVQTWGEVMPFLKDAAYRLKLVLRGVSAVLFLLVVFGVVNTMLMNVYERVREIGTMLAVGVRRWQIRALFVVEAAALGFIGGSIGVLLGFSSALAFAKDGVVFTPPGAAFTYVVRPVPPVEVAIAALLVAVIGGALAALYPANKAAALSPVEALRGS